MASLLLILGIILSALCEYLAASLRNLRQSVISVMADEGSAVAQRICAAYDDIDETTLSVSLVDIVAVTISAIALTTMADGSMLLILLQMLGLIIILTIAKVVASTAGVRYAEHTLSFTGYLLATVRIVSLPVRFFYRILMRLTKHQSDEEEAREELEALVETAREEGALDPGEYRIMSNIMQLSSIAVQDVMTPRTVVFGLPETTTVEDALKKPELQMYSRFPVYEGNNPDSVIGYVFAKDVLRAALAGRKTAELGKLKRQVHFMPENITLERALEQFLQQKQHMFMVVDEHGGVEGMVTMEDVLETMLGAEIVDEADHVVDLRQLAKQRRDARIAQRESLKQPVGAGQ